MFSRFKPLIERYPALAFVYRTLRDARAMQQQKPQVTPYGFKMVGNTAMQTGTFEPEETTLLQHYFFIDEADVFVDVGANIGFYACLARSFGIYTIAIEPLAQNLNYLYANLNENRWNDVEVYPVALGNQPGIATLYGASTGASLICGWAGASPLLRQTVPISTLDILLGVRFAGKRLIIKVDVEGAEYAMLKGAVSTLAMSPRPIWLVEVALSEHHPSGLSPNYAKTFELFWQSGYEARTADKESRIVLPAHVERWVKIGTCDFGYNYVFRPKL